ncbi:aminoglycoside phosphotransferase family protein [Streptomyces sp. NPDC048383]|uniref:aminoglycoside phosphotransferase family protein n=1 Tax=Streptomyces sp. NPDC048383 TaxID=3155386 RepID=UPI00342B2761
MPSDRVHEFNDYLRGVPMDFDGDDDVLGEFRDAYRISGYQIVPHLVEHDDGDSLSGCAVQGPRRSACYLPDVPNPDEWLRQTPPEKYGAVPFVHFREGSTRIEFRDGAENGGSVIHLDWATACRRLGIGIGAALTASRTALIRRPSTAADTADRQLWEQVAQDFAIACFLLGWTSEELAAIESTQPRADFGRARPLDEALTVRWARTGLPQSTPPVRHRTGRPVVGNTRPSHAHPGQSAIQAQASAYGAATTEEPQTMNDSNAASGTTGGGSSARAEALPSQVAACLSAWDLELEPEQFTLTFNYVCPATRSGHEPVVLKVSPPDSIEYHRELAVLDAYGGHGSVRVLERDPALGAVLLERLLPGTTLTELFPHHEHRANDIAAKVLAQLWRRVPPAGLPDVLTWGEALLRPERLPAGAIAEYRLAHARQCYTELAASGDEEVLLHGDLHHGNILLSPRGWLAIDPKGLVGERAFDLGALLRNPAPTLIRTPDVRALLSLRIDQMSEKLGLDRARVRSWAYAQAVLSACWAVEDDDSEWVGYALACAELLAP